MLCSHKANLAKTFRSFLKCKDLKPNMHGINTIMKVVELEISSKHVTANGQAINVAEAKVADDTGCITMVFKGEQMHLCQEGVTLIVRNGRMSEIGGYLRLEVDRWGEIIISEKTAQFSLNLKNDLSTPSICY